MNIVKILLIVIVAIPATFLGGCLDDKKEKDSNNLSIEQEIMGTWKTANCFVSEFDKNQMEYLEITSVGIKETRQIYHDENCQDLNYETATDFQEYQIGEKVLSDSGLEVYQIDWRADVGDAYVGVNQIITVIDEQLFLGIPIHWGGHRASELNFDTPYNRSISSE